MDGKPGSVLRDLLPADLSAKTPRLQERPRATAGSSPFPFQRKGLLDDCVGTELGPSPTENVPIRFQPRLCQEGLLDNIHMPTGAGNCVLLRLRQSEFGPNEESCRA